MLTYSARAQLQRMFQLRDLTLQAEILLGVPPLIGVKVSDGVREFGRETARLLEVLFSSSPAINPHCKTKYVFLGARGSLTRWMFV